MINLTIVVPTIRLENWLRLYNSIELSCEDISFELILIGPRYSPVLERYKNVKFIQDYSSPNRCQQIGLINAHSETIIFAADDCIFAPKMLKKCYSLNREHDKVIVTQYSEGPGHESQDKYEYYVLNKAYPKCKFIKDNWVIFNCAILDFYKLIEIGGFDTRFQVPAFGYADLAARWQLVFGENSVLFLNDKLLHCDHGQQDHVPIEIAHVYEDTPLYNSIYNNQENRGMIDLNNYLNTPKVWSKR